MLRKRLNAAALAILVAGCATIVPDLPAITDAPTDQRHAGKIVWHDLLTNTPEESKEFYGALFGWTFESPTIDLGFGTSDTYTLIRHNGFLIGGMFDTNTLQDDKDISQWVTVISVADIESAAADVTNAGGKVLTPPVALATRGSIAVLEDPTGALFALIESASGDPADGETAFNGFLWDELWTGNVSQASDFYQQVIGYDSEDRVFGEDGGTYHLLKMGDTLRAGILENPFEGERPVWVNYLRVEDPAAIAARVEELGGRILIKAQDRDIGGKVAFIAGPSGAGIVLQTWPPE